MKDTFYRSSFTREHQNFHLSKRDEPKLAGCNGVSTGPVAETLHEQDTVIESRESRIDIALGTRKGRRPRTTDAMQELQAAVNRQFWITTSKGTPEKRPNYKGTLEASQPR